MEFRQLLRNQQLEESTTCNIGQNDNCIVLIDSESLSPIEQLTLCNESLYSNHNDGFSNLKMKRLSVKGEDL